MTIESDIQGVIGDTTLDAEGRFSDFGNLDEGTHIITVTATDSGGKTGRDQEEVEVLPENSLHRLGRDRPIRDEPTRSPV